MDRHIEDRRVTACRARLLRAPVAVAALLLSTSAAAIGTDAGRRIDSTAQATYDILGVTQPGINSNTVTVVVDEVLDTVVIDAAAGPVQVTSGSSGAALWFTITNTGNGTEAFRLAVDAAVPGDDFDPTSPLIYLESNGTAGLQVGPGGDTLYSLGANDPVLARDASMAGYVTADIPSSLATGALGRVQLRAVSQTVFVGSGTEDPANPAFPAPGTTYPGAGDPASGGGNVNAVVGNSHAPATLSLQAFATYRANAALVTLTKAVLSVTDPFGGTTLVPGSVIRYQITVGVAGSGTAEDLVVRDPLPATLAFVAGSLTVAPLPPGQEVDDDFNPSGTDATGFDGLSSTVVSALGDAPGGGPPVLITFDATIR